MAIMVIVTGLPGTGKTFFAKRLATQINAIHINSDKIRVEQNLTGQYDVQTKQKVYDKMLSATKTALQNFKNVVVDSTFYQESTRNIFIELATELDCCWQILQITASDKTVKERVSSQREFSEADFEVYQSIKASYQTIKEPHFILNSDEMPVEQMIVQAKEYMYHDKIRYSRFDSSNQEEYKSRVNRNSYILGASDQRYCL